MVVGVGRSSPGPGEEVEGEVMVGGAGVEGKKGTLAPTWDGPPGYAEYDCWPGCNEG
jgi:hypothetical protein